MLAVLIVAAFIRLWNIGQIGFNSDEAVYAGQAAALAGREEYVKQFSLVRAHPLLFQFFLSLIYRITVSDVFARMLSAMFGLLTVYFTYNLGKILFNKRVGSVAAMFLGVTPYHVIVSRQALLEPTLTFFTTLTMYSFAKYQLNKNSTWAYLVGVSSALSFLSKEVGIFVVGIITLLLLSGYYFKLNHMVIVLCSFLLTVSPHIFTIFASEATETAWNYILWQISRPPNHPPLFYLENLPCYFSWPLLVLLILGYGYAVYKHRPPHVLCLVWFAVIFIFFQFLPTKGFHYLLPLSPAACLIATLPLDVAWSSSTSRRKFYMLVFIALITTALIYNSTLNGVFTIDQSKIGLAGYSGLPKAREVALWIKENTPEGSRILTIGPTMANVIRFYAPNREVYALSISQNPLRRNPSYKPLENPDLMLRFALINYVVFDTYSASRSPYFANTMLYYIAKYEYELVHVECPFSTLDSNVTIPSPLISIYEVKSESGGL